VSGGAGKNYFPLVTRSYRSQDANSTNESQDSLAVGSGSKFGIGSLHESIAATDLLPVLIRACQEMAIIWFRHPSESVSVEISYIDTSRLHLIY
jgi:hypothetical protein